MLLDIRQRASIIHPGANQSTSATLIWWTVHNDRGKCSQTKAIGGVETVKWDDMFSLVNFMYLRPQLNFTPNPLTIRESQQKKKKGTEWANLYASLILRIDRTNDLDPHILTLEESSLVHISVPIADGGRFSRPFNLSRVQLALGRQRLGQPKKIIQVLRHPLAFFF